MQYHTVTKKEIAIKMLFTALLIMPLMAGFLYLGFTAMEKQMAISDAERADRCARHYLAGYCD